MYSVHAYYLATALRACTCAWIYPVCVGVGSFYFFDLPDSAPTDLCFYTGILFLLAYCGSIFGLVIGCFTDSTDLAIGVAQMIVIFMNFGAGVFANAGAGANPVI